MKPYLFYLLCLLLIGQYSHAQKYKNGTRLLKGAEVLSNTPLQLDYVLDKLSDTAKVTSLHEGKTHLILEDGSGVWREWWFIKGKWQPKATVTTNIDTLVVTNFTKDTLVISKKDTLVINKVDSLIINHSTKDTLVITTKDTLIINNFTKDTLVISNKDTLVIDHVTRDTIVIAGGGNDLIDGENGSLLYLQRARPTPIPYLNVRAMGASSGFPSVGGGGGGIGIEPAPQKGLDINFATQEGLNMNLILNGEGYTYSTFGGDPEMGDILHRSNNGELYFQVSKVNQSHSSLSMTINNMVLYSPKLQLYGDKVSHNVSDYDKSKNTSVHLPDKSYFRIETEPDEQYHPYSEFYIDKSKLEFRTGTLQQWNGVETLTPTEPFFTVGDHFNYRDYFKYNTNSNSFIVKNEIVLVNRENQPVGTIAVTSNDISFKSNATGGNPVTLLQIYNFLLNQISVIHSLSPRSGKPIEDSKTPQISTATAIPQTTTAIATVTTYFICGDNIPTPLENTLYLQLNSSQELWLHLKMNGIIKRVKL